jgi:hypothetical protein
MGGLVMIYDVRTYTLHPRMMNKYLGLFEKLAMPVANQHGFRLIGYFSSKVGTLNQIVHIWAFEDLAEFEVMRAKRDQDSGWHKFLDSTTGMVATQEDKIMSPAKFSPLQ